MTPIRPASEVAAERRRGIASRSLALLLLLACAVPTASVGAPEATLAPRFRVWLEEVELLIGPEEREAFLGLDRDYQRDAFVRRFWQLRDPFPDTPRNELAELWDARLAMARERFGSLAGDRARVLLVLGPPDRVSPLHCAQAIFPLEVWSWSRTEPVAGEIVFVFVRDATGEGDRYRLWSPLQGIGSLLRSPAGAASMGRVAEETVVERCVLGEEILATLRQALDWPTFEEQVELLPRPDPEWVEAFLARGTELPEESDTFAAALDFAFPGRRQGRTAVQTVVRVESEELRAAAVGGEGTFGFVLDGEVLRQGELFEGFRYRFDVPAAEVGGGPVPLIVERYLRPGSYTFIVRVEDRGSRRFFRREVELEVPRLTRVAAPEEGVAESLASRLEEANRSLAEGEDRIEIRPLPQVLQTGRLRVEAAATGEHIDRVRFLLGGKAVMSKRRPPFSVELDLGSAPRIQLLEAVALDADGTELARDETLINAGPYRFEVKLYEPRRGARYRHSLRARAEVQLPASERLDRVEFYLGDNLVATLFQPPWVQPILLPEGSELSFVRAVAYLDDGASTEDLVLLNAPPDVDRIQMSFVELYTTVVDRRGRPVDGLTAEDFSVSEDGEPQTIRRFERVTDLRLHAGILLDTSISMEEEIREVERAALQFFDSVIGPGDRAAVIVFNERPDLIVPFTGSHETLAGGLADLLAEGQTALHDSLVFALHQFGGIRGQRALVLISDGGDTRSRTPYEQALDFARHAGVAIYPIALDLPSGELLARSRLEGLAEATGGRCFFIDGTQELDRVYRELESELHSQYLIAYQSTQEGDEGFRRVEVEVAKPGLTAKTIPGYFP